MQVLLSKIYRFVTIIGLGLILIIMSFFVGGKFGSAGTGKTSLITGVPFAYADAPTPTPPPAPVGCAGTGGSGGSSCSCSSCSSN